VTDGKFGPFLKPMTLKRQNREKSGEEGNEDCRHGMSERETWRIK